MKREFKGVWIHKDIWLAESLSLQEKVFLAEIDSLDNEDGCFANNEYFAKFFGISKVRVSEVINSLVSKGYITSSIKQEEGNKRILKTLANFSLRPSQTKDEDPRKVSFKHNNTISNTSINTISNSPQVEVVPLLPFGSDEFLNAWKEWVEYRKQKKQKLTPKSIERQLKELGGRPEKEAIAMIEQSIMNGWTGIFEIKKQFNGQTKGFDAQAAINAIYGNK